MPGTFFRAGMPKWWYRRVDFIWSPLLLVYLWQLHAVPSCTHPHRQHTSPAGNFNHKDALMNFVQIYDTDVAYALGLSNCNMLQIADTPLSTLRLHARRRSLRM